MNSLSVVIATHGRTRALGECLKSLTESHSQNERWDVWIGINGSDPETEAFLANWSPPPEMTVHLKGSSKPVSPAQMRNQLIQNCRAPWILFLDDDVRLIPGSIRAFKSALEHYRDATVIGGPNLNPPESTFFEHVSGHVLGRRLVTWFSQSRYRPQGELRLCGEDSLILCGLFVKKEALGTAPFLSDLVCAEENWFLHELQQKGHRLVYSPEVAVYHQRRPTWNQFARQLFRYGTGRGQMLRRRPQSIRPPHLVPSTFLVYLLGLLAMLLLGGIIPWWGFVPLGMYLVIVTLSGLTSWAGHLGSWREFLLEVFLYPLAHLSYGAGLLWGVARPRHV